MTKHDHPVVGVVLAGGQARRMGGGDKCLLQIGEQSLLARCIDRLSAQVGPLVINANGDPSRFASFDLPVVSDSIEDYAGPLAGILAGMRWAAQHSPGARHIVTIASDTPFFPLDLVTKLLAGVEENDRAIALAHSSSRVHPVFGLWPVALADDLEEALGSGVRKILAWTDRHEMIEVPFGVHQKDGQEIDPFFNVNRPEDLARAECFAETII